jgi:hypothetical protein
VRDGLGRAAAQCGNICVYMIHIRITTKISIRSSAAASEASAQWQLIAARATADSLSCLRQLVSCSSSFHIQYALERDRISAFTYQISRSDSGALSSIASASRAANESFRSTPCDADDEEDEDEDEEDVAEVDAKKMALRDDD